MARAHGVGQRLAQPIERARADGVLEARERRLRGQAPAADGIAIEQQLLDRVPGQAIGIVAAGIPARETEDTLRDQVAESMRQTGLIACIRQRLCQGRRQTEPAIDRLQENCSTVRTRMGLIERMLTIEEVGERTVCGSVASFNSRASVCRKVPSARLLYHSKAFLLVLTHTDS